MSIMFGSEGNKRFRPELRGERLRFEYLDKHERRLSSPPREFKIKGRTVIKKLNVHFLLRPARIAASCAARRHEILRLSRIFCAASARSRKTGLTEWALMGRSTPSGSAPAKNDAAAAPMAATSPESPMLHLV